ncbi:MAG: helix-turn-helix domain-containing protein [Streptosporangiaceae bacterium]
MTPQHLETLDYSVPALEVPPATPQGVVVPLGLCQGVDMLLGRGLEWTEARDGVRPRSPDLNRLRAQLHAAGLAALASKTGASASRPLSSTMGAQVQDRWLTVSEAAEVMGICERQAQRFAHGGRIRARRWGRRDWQIAQDAAENYGRRRRERERIARQGR